MRRRKVLIPISLDMIGCNQGREVSINIGGDLGADFLFGVARETNFHVIGSVPVERQ